VIVDLIETGIEETFKLDLCNRTNSIDRHAEGRGHNPQLRQWRIDHPVLSEFLLQAVCDAKDTSFSSHILAQDNNPVVSFHLFSKS
jgi:hypothetical protein